jgi:hypothetical protein
MNEDLFEGLQILSPQEIEQSLAPPAEKNEDGDLEKPLNESLIIEPVVHKEEEGEIVKGETKTIESTSNEKVYKALMKELVNDGILTLAEVEELENLPGNKESLQKLIVDTAETKLKQKEDNWKRSFSGAKKRFLEIEDAYDDADKAIIASQRLEFFDGINDTKLSEDINLQKNIYFESLIVKGMSKEEAVEALQDAEAIGKLDVKAKAALSYLKIKETEDVEKERTNRTVQQEKETKTQTEMFDKLVASIESKESFVDGLSLTKLQKDKIKANITTPVYKDDQGKEFTSLMYKQHKNPAEFEMLINYYDTLGLFNIAKDGSLKPDISKLKAVAKTQAVTELDRVIAESSNRSPGRNSSMDSSERGAGILSALEGAFGKK